MKIYHACLVKNKNTWRQKGVKSGCTRRHAYAQCKLYNNCTCRSAPVNEQCQIPYKQRPQTRKKHNTQGWFLAAIPLFFTFHRLMWQWHPLPAAVSYSFGKKLSTNPCCAATAVRASLVRMTSSAAVMAGAWAVTISNWPMHDSEWYCSTRIPMLSREQHMASSTVCMHTRFLPTCFTSGTYRLHSAPLHGIVHSWSAPQGEAGPWTT